VVRTLGALRPAPGGESSDLGACGRRLRGDSAVVIFSDFLADDEMRGDLAALLERSTSLHALQITDPADAALPAAGEVDLVDVESGASITALVDDRTHALAADERTTLARRLRAFCRRSGIAYTAWDIARPWQQTLIEHLAQARSVC
jgi:uncharacterized protein (DUF58 family)